MTCDSHDISSHHLADSYQGWPKLLFAVYERDATALVDSLVGYGVAALPLSPGAHDVSARACSSRTTGTRARRRARATTSPRRAPSSRAGARRCCAARRCTPRRWSPRGWNDSHEDRRAEQEPRHLGPARQTRAARRRRAGGAPRAARGPRGDRSPSPVRPNAEDTRRGLDSVRRRFADAATRGVAGAERQTHPSPRAALARARAPRGGCLQHGGGAWPRGCARGEAAAPGGAGRGTRVPAPGTRRRRW